MRLMVSRLDANWRDPNVRDGMKKLARGLGKAPKANQLASFLHSCGSTSVSARKYRAQRLRSRSRAYRSRLNIRVQPTTLARRKRKRKSLIRNIAYNQANAQKH